MANRSPTSMSAWRMNVYLFSLSRPPSRTKKEAGSCDPASSHLREASRLGDVWNPKVPIQARPGRHISIGGHPSSIDRNMWRSVVSKEKIVLSLGRHHVRFSNPDMRVAHDSSQSLTESDGVSGLPQCEFRMVKQRSSCVSLSFCAAPSLTCSPSAGGET